jgi:hypothetical protein
MSKLTRYFVGASAFVTGVMASGAVWAGPGVQPISVPEPGIFGIIAGGMAAVIFAARLRNRK